MVSSGDCNIGCVYVQGDLCRTPLSPATSPHPFPTVALIGHMFSFAHWLCPGVPVPPTCQVGTSNIIKKEKKKRLTTGLRPIIGVADGGPVPTWLMSQPD